MKAACRKNPPVEKHSFADRIDGGKNAIGDGGCD
jgi:hypothetical protein